MPTRLICAAAAVLSLIAGPATAQEIPADAEKVLSCSIIFSLKAEDATDAGDSGAATEWQFRAEELDGRGRAMLADAGFNGDATENVVMNLALTVGFNAGLGAPPFTDAECFELIG